MLPPGPRTPAFWQTFSFVLRPREYSRAVTARYGRTMRFRALDGKGITTSDPALVRQIFATDPSTFEAIPVLTEIFGSQSVLATSGGTHRRQRKLLNPRFHGGHIKSLAATMQEVVRSHLARFERARRTGEVIVMSDLAQELTLDIILETAFGQGGDIDRQEARKVLNRVVDSLAPVTIFSWVLRTRLFPPWKRFLAARAAFDAWIDRLVAARRARGASGTDILGMLLDARYEDGSTMDDAEIRDQMMGLLTAGHETTAVALAWAVYWLIREPKEAAEVRRAVEELGADPSPEAFAKIPRLEAFISETLRIEPIITDVQRICCKPLALGEWTVPAGETVSVNISAILSDPEIFPEPERFRPARFLERTFHTGELMPFGGGSRRCLGAAFAEMELGIAIATIATEWDLALADRAPERSVRRNITMGPERGVRVKVLGARERRPAAGDREARA